MSKEKIIDKSRRAFSNEIIMNENYSSMWQQALRQVIPTNKNESNTTRKHIKPKGKA